MKMFSWKSLVSVCLWSVLAGESLDAQSRFVVTSDASRRVGLEAMWQTTISTGPSAHISHITAHASPKNSFTSFQVTDAVGRKYFFSERDLDLLGQPMGVDEAQRHAEMKVLELKARGRNPQMETRSVAEVRLYVQTSDGSMQAVDGETGRSFWTTQIGKPYYSSVPGVANDEFVVAVSGSSLYVLDSTTGRVLKSTPLLGIAGAALSIHGNRVYVPTTAGKIDCYDLSNPGRVLSSVGSSGAVRTAPCLTATSIGWTTESGDLFVADASRGSLKFRFSAQDDVVSAPVTLPPNLICMTSLDGAIYALNENSGAVPWRVSTGEPISHTPLVAGDELFVATDAGQLYAVDGKTGDVRWMRPGIEQPITASSDRIFAIGYQDRRLWAIDRATGEALGYMSLFGTDMLVANRVSDRVYLANSRGVVQGFREIGQQLPSVRATDASATETKTDNGKAKSESTTDQQPKVSPGELPPPARNEDNGNPFGDDDGNLFRSDGTGDSEPAVDEGMDADTNSEAESTDAASDENPFDFGGDNPFEGF